MAANGCGNPTVAISDFCNKSNITRHIDRRPDVRKKAKETAKTSQKSHWNCRRIRWKIHGTKCMREFTNWENAVEEQLESVYFRRISLG